MEQRSDSFSDSRFLGCDSSDRVRRAGKRGGQALEQLY